VFREAFEAAYRRLYGRVIDGIGIEVLSWTLTLAAPARAAPHTVVAVDGDSGELPPQPLFDPAGETVVEARVFLRERLRPGESVAGPALITEAQTTTVVPPAWRATVDERGHLVLERKA
jgi:N-methylhydantoinase A